MKGRTALYFTNLGMSECYWYRTEEAKEFSASSTVFLHCSLLVLFTSASFRCKLKFIAFQSRGYFICLGHRHTMALPVSSCCRLWRGTCEWIVVFIFPFICFGYPLGTAEEEASVAITGQDENRWQEGGESSCHPLVKTLSRPLHCVITLVVSSILSFHQKDPTQSSVTN